MQSKSSLTAAGAVAGLLAIGGGLLLARSSGSRGNNDDAPGRTTRNNALAIMP